MNPLEIARKIFPDLTDQELEFIIWEETGFPTFFAPRPGESIIDVFKRQLQDYKEYGPTPKN